MLKDTFAVLPHGSHSLLLIESKHHAAIKMLAKVDKLLQRDDVNWRAVEDAAVRITGQDEVLSLGNLNQLHGIHQELLSVGLRAFEAARAIRDLEGDASLEGLLDD